MNLLLLAPTSSEVKACQCSHFALEANVLPKGLKLSVHSLYDENINSGTMGCYISQTVAARGVGRLTE